ncbi:MAG: hypothetical protein ACD_71C00103G0003 [uncultured bacterium (gcode 4)]|uniref:Uncharacterized protein n=1 Tax=uncultured bacterium (gcode 4) TaxID=1234023 RepID=K1Z5P9_9BACT|nr:MAG: hypothetical protein ACD_71C00103G0003 [uncultured bacterium (gcode 4)]
MGYDFSQLNDKEFEILTVDLLSVVFGIRIQRYKTGKDGGVDGSFFIDDKNEVILQCKHYLKTGYQWLISKLRNEEVEKVGKLKPSKYIFVTSLSLSKDNKKEIKTLFSPYIKRIDDIFGQEDLNDILSKNPSIEEKHFKLWISSTNVFNRIINNAIKGRSEFELNQIQKKSHKYIRTENHQIALEKLIKNHVLIISGEPGVWKTTLAENLCLHFASKDYEFISIEEPFNEAENIYTKWKKQIFYFDDFLWSNYLEAIENRKDTFIVKFIERIKDDATKRFILTTRTNILNSWVTHSSIFATKNLQKNEFMLTVGNLTSFDKASILYNHIWFSKMNNGFIDEIYVERRYKNIIAHKNFNPRLIEFITDIDRTESLDSSEYWSYIKETLNNPKDIWRDCFNIQHDEFVRNLVILVAFDGWVIGETSLQKWFDRLIEIESLKSNSHTIKNFNSTTKLSTKSFLNRNKSWEAIIYSLFNPSISDFIYNEYWKDTNKLIQIFKSLYSVSSLRKLDWLGTQKIIPNDTLLKIKETIFLDAFIQKKDYDYLIYVSNYFLTDKTKELSILNNLQNIINKPKKIEEFQKFLYLLNVFHTNLQIKDYLFLEQCIEERQLTLSELENLITFIEGFNIRESILLETLKKIIGSYLYNTLIDWLIDVDLQKYANQEGYFDKQWLESYLLKKAEDIINNFHSDIVEELNIDITGIVMDDLDFNGALEDYKQSLIPCDKESNDISLIDFDKDIDNLFQRT